MSEVERDDFAFRIANDPRLVFLQSGQAAVRLGKNGEERTQQVFENLMLFSGSLIGLFCLILVPVVYRVRRVPPPIGIVMFAIFISTAPIVAFTARIMM